MSKIVYFFALVMALVLAFAMAQEEVTTYNLNAISKKAIDIAPLFEEDKECAGVFADDKYVLYYAEDATAFNAVVTITETNTDIEKFVESACGKALVELDADIAFTATVKAECVAACGLAECLCLEGDACVVPTGDDDVNPCGGEQVVCKDDKCVKDEEEEPVVTGEVYVFTFDRNPLALDVDTQFKALLDRVEKCSTGKEEGPCKDNMDTCLISSKAFSSILRTGKNTAEIVSFGTKCTDDQLKLLLEASASPAPEPEPEPEDEDEDEEEKDEFNLLDDDEDSSDDVNEIELKSLVKAKDDVTFPQKCTADGTVTKCVGEDAECERPCFPGIICEDDKGCQYGDICVEFDVEKELNVCTAVSSASIAQITLAIVLTIAAFIF